MCPRRASGKRRHQPAHHQTVTRCRLRWSSCFSMSAFFLALRRSTLKRVLQRTKRVLQRGPSYDWFSQSPRTYSVQSSRSTSSCEAQWAGGCQMDRPQRGQVESGWPGNRGSPVQVGSSQMASHSSHKIKPIWSSQQMRIPNRPCPQQRQVPTKYTAGSFARMVQAGQNGKAVITRSSSRTRRTRVAGGFPCLRPCWPPTKPIRRCRSTSCTMRAPSRCDCTCGLARLTSR